MKQSVVFLLALTATVQAQRNLKELPPVGVDSQLESFQLAPGLEVNLFASEPLIAKPIQMAWDERGRLWVASSSIYPHIKPGQTQADKIVILEDTDKDGKADKSTVFYEGLLIPTGILPGDGGAYVANSTELLFMQDTNGDGRADTSRVLLSGFGTEDTHHILHSIKRGPDGCLYFAQSVYIHSRIETPFGPRELRGSGWWQFRPETGRLEVYSMGQVNPWGMIWNRWGQTFTTDGAYGEGINYTFPGATFLCLPNQLPRILKGLNPGQPKQCGLEVISGRHFPDEWQGQLITADFRGHRVNRFALTPEGSGYSSRQMEDVVASTHGSFRPVDVRMGADGALYLADWFNPIIQHGEVDFHDERRDRQHGRIWRITAKGRPLDVLPRFADAGTAGLLELLTDPADWVRIEAKQELKRRKLPDLVAQVEQWVARAGGDSAVRREAIGLLLTTRQLSANSPLMVLQGDPGLMAWVVRAAGQLYGEGQTGPDGLLAEAVRSEHAQVRLEAIHALRLKGDAAAVETATAVLAKPMDANLDFALWLTCRERADQWLPEFRKGSIAFDSDVTRIAFALKSADRPEAVGALLEMVGKGTVKGDRAGEVIGLVGQLGSVADVTALLKMAAVPDATPALQDAVFRALTTAVRQRKIQPEGDLAWIVERIRAGNPTAAALAGAWKLEAARGALQDAGAKGSAEALQGLAELGGPAAQDFFREAWAKSDRKPSPQTTGFLTAWISLDAGAAAPEAVKYLSAMPEADAGQATPVFEAFLSRKEGPAILTAALRDQKLPAPVATAGVQKASASGGQNQDLLQILTVAGGLQPVGQGMGPEDLARMLAEVKTSGDAARGEGVYRRAALLCQSCHAIGAVGGIVGPDMLSIGASAPVDYIIDSLLEPSKKIKEGYATTVVNTRDGGVHAGFLVREDARELLLRDAVGATQSIPAGEVASRQNMPVSLMPPGLTASLRRDEFVDLVRFLSELGKEGKYKIQSDGLIRRWRLPQPGPDFWQVINREGLRALTQEPAGLNWVPAYSQVDGTLPVAEIPPVKLHQAQGRVAQGEVEVTTPGAAVLSIADPGAMKLWIGDREYSAASTVPVELSAGKHRVTILLDPAARKTPLQVEIAPAPGSPTRVVPVGGP